MKSLLATSGELAGLIRDLDWSKTPLGPIETWPQSLITATNLLLASPVPIVLLWGPEGVMIYNDAYSDFAGDRHPSLLGSEVRKGWTEVADFNDNVMKVGLAGGTLSYQDQELTLYRTGGPEQVFMDLYYSPVLDESGNPGGVIAIVVETTARVTAARHGEALIRLADRLRDLEGEREIVDGAAELLRTTMRVDRVGYGVVDAEAETLLVERDWTAPGIGSVTGKMSLRDYGSFVEDLRNGEVVAIADAQAISGSAATFEMLARRGVRSLVGVPVLDQGRLVAVLFVSDSAVRRWSAEDIAFVRAVAERTRTALERARTQATLRESEGLFRFLDALGRAVSARSGADEILAITTRMVGEHLGVSVCAYADMDEDQDGFSIRGDWAAAGSTSIVGHYSLADFGKLAVTNLGAGKPLIVNDNLEELAPEEAATFQNIGISATICMPLVKQGRLTALMAIHDKAPRIWSPYELTVIREVTERSWAHVERAAAEAELRASARALSDLNETLEQRVEERTTQLMRAEDALRQAQKMEAVGQLTGGLAHDFNNLLTGIGGSLELMQARIAQGRLDTVDRYITAAQGAVRRAASLTHRLLAFSRRQTLDPRATNINRLIAGMEELIRRTVGPATELEVVGAAGLWSTFVDPNQLENALLNLCINARDAMPDGGRLTIETANTWLDERAAQERELEPGQYVSLCVTDTGTGMTPEVMSKAFDPFFTTKPLGEGTGLGLSMIYGFARQSGGQVRIYSEVGNGTTMCLYLPRHDQDAGAEIEAPALHAPDQSGRGEVVLVIDDEPTVRMLVAEVLAEAGYATIEAADGPSGLKIVESGVRIDLLITDVGLPGGMNGRQVADAARVLRPELKVLFITGYAENAVVGNGHLERGMSLVTKPFQIDILGRKIREAIEG